MFQPGIELFKQLNLELAGLWYGIADNEHDVSVVAKLPTNVIKSIYRRVKTEFILSVIETDKIKMVFSALKIYDIPENPVGTSLPIHKESDYHNILSLIQQEVFFIHFFDERARHVLSSTCSFDKSRSLETYNNLIRYQPYYFGEPNYLIKIAHDIFQEDQNRVYKREETRSIMNQILQLSFKSFDIQNTWEVVTGQNIPHKYNIDNTDHSEGVAQERHITTSLEYIYDKKTHHSPQIATKENQYRELIDTLCFDSNGILLLESKVLPVLSANRNRQTKRIKASIQKNIKKGLKQLKGAIRFLKSDIIIFNRNSLEIFIPDRDKLPIYAILLISDMIIDDEENKILAKELINLSTNQESIFFYIFDFKQLQRIIAFSKNSSHNFLNILKDIHITIEKEESINISIKVSPFE